MQSPFRDWHIGKDAKPAEGVDPLEALSGICRYRLSARPVKPVASHDEATIHPLLRAIRIGPRHMRRVAFHPVQRNLARAVFDLQPALVCGLHQVAGQFGLAIDHHPAAGEVGQVDAYQPLAVGQLKTIVPQTLGFQPCVEAKSLHQRHRDRFEHASANATEDVIRALPVEHQAIDPLGP